MAEYQITLWREIPSMVVVREGDEVVKVSLANRFQEAIDEAAMRLNESDADAYLAGWNRSEWTAHAGSPAEVAEAISAKLEEEFTEERLNQLLDAL
jgi:hypothetical protein